MAVDIGVVKGHMVDSCQGHLYVSRNLEAGWDIQLLLFAPGVVGNVVFRSLYQSLFVGVDECPVAEGCDGQLVAAVDIKGSWKISAPVFAGPGADGDMVVFVKLLVNLNAHAAHYVGLVEFHVHVHVIHVLDL